MPAAQEATDKLTQEARSMSTDRTKIAVAALGTGLALSIAVQAPALLPALTFGLAVWMVASVFLKL
jgi:hypothetical protein